MDKIHFFTKKNLTVKEVKKIIKLINESLDIQAIPLSKNIPLCIHKKINDINEYIFTSNITLSFTDLDKINKCLLDKVNVSFKLKILSLQQDEIKEEKTHKEMSDEEAHSQWLNEMKKNGWRYGMDHDEKNKTSPFLKPYTDLTKNQKKYFSKDKKGKYSLFYPDISGMTIGEDKA